MLPCHPRDIARYALSHADEGSALVFVTGVEGGSVRAPGLRMAVTLSGQSAGFVSNGCVEADLVSLAKAAIAARKVEEVIYGRDGGKVDIVLPCGGSVHLLIVPVTGAHVQALSAMEYASRNSGIIAVDAGGGLEWSNTQLPAPKDHWHFTVHPKIRLVIAGSGVEALLLASLAVAADMVVELHSPDKSTVEQAVAIGLSCTAIKGLSSKVDLQADSLTAVALMFHDHEWEQRLLCDALTGPAFYIGALGSRHAHAARVAALAGRGITQKDIDRIKAPIGIVHRLRDPNLLAASVIAEIAAEFQKRFTAF